MLVKFNLQAFFLGLGCYFIEYNFFSGLFHPWLNLFLVISIIIIFRKSKLWWSWFVVSLIFVWLGVGGWWWLSFALTLILAWWLRRFFSGSSYFWELSVFALVVFLSFFLLLLAVKLLDFLIPTLNWPDLSWGRQWWLYFIFHFILLYIAYWLTSFSRETR